MTSTYRISHTETSVCVILHCSKLVFFKSNKGGEPRLFGKDKPACFGLKDRKRGR